MLLAAFDWLVDATALLETPKSAPKEMAKEKIA